MRLHYFELLFRHWNSKLARHHFVCQTLVPFNLRLHLLQRCIVAWRSEWDVAALAAVPWFWSKLLSWREVCLCEACVSSLLWMFEFVTDFASCTVSFNIATHAQFECATVSFYFGDSRVPIFAIVRSIVSHLETVLAVISQSDIDYGKWWLSEQQLLLFCLIVVKFGASFFIFPESHSAAFLSEACEIWVNRHWLWLFKNCWLRLITGLSQTSIDPRPWSG